MEESICSFPALVYLNLTTLPTVKAYMYLSIYKFPQITFKVIFYIDIYLAINMHIFEFRTMNLVKTIPCYNFGAFHAIFRNEKRVFRQVLWKIVRHFSGMLWLGLFSQDKNVIVILACGAFYNLRNMAYLSTHCTSGTLWSFLSWKTRITLKAIFSFWSWLSFWSLKMHQ